MMMMMVMVMKQAAASHVQLEACCVHLCMLPLQCCVRIDITTNA